MLVKDMCLRKNSFIYFIAIFIFFFQKNVFANESLNEKAFKYLNDLKFFSASFIQDDKSSISQGRIYIGKERIRIEYETPTKILIILDENKAMYFNYELDEDEFFNPRDTSASIFFEIFNNIEFFSNSMIVSEDSYLIFEKSGESDIGNYKVRVFFENNPVLIRKIELFADDLYLTLSIFDHNYNERFDKNFFKLINPSFF